jgi:hypothetical protein
MEVSLRNIALRVGAAASLLCFCGSALAVSETSQPLQGDQWKTLALITGFHSVVLKQRRLEVRILEADGSRSVAQDPVSLYLVVTNNGTDDAAERVWRVPRTVSKVRRVLPTACGVEMVVDVDRKNVGPVMLSTVRSLLELCFLSPVGELQTALTFTEKSPGQAAAPPNRALQTDGASRRR